jgi:hypothetical protein
LRRNIQKSIDDISREHGCGARAAPQSDGEANNIAANYGRQEQCPEEAAAVALQAGCEIEFSAGGVYDHAPLQDAESVREQVTCERRGEMLRRHTRDRRADCRKRKKMQQHADHGKRGNPSQSDECPPAGAPPRSLRLHHEREITTGRLSQNARYIAVYS